MWVDPNSRWYKITFGIDARASCKNTRFARDKSELSKHLLEIRTSTNYQSHIEIPRERRLTFRSASREIAASLARPRVQWLSLLIVITEYLSMDMGMGMAFLWGGSSGRYYRWPQAPR